MDLVERRAEQRASERGWSRVPASRVTPLKSQRRVERRKKRENRSRQGGKEVNAP